MGKHLDPGLIMKKCHSCYWCGSIPVCESNRSSFEHAETTGWRVCCPVCSSAGPRVEFMWDAIDAWNDARRHFDDIPRGVEVTFTIAPEGHIASSSGTEKQKKYAVSIAKHLDINLPNDMSKENLRSWIGLFDPVVHAKISHFDALLELSMRINCGSKEGLDAASEMMSIFDKESPQPRHDTRFCMAPANLIHMTARELGIDGYEFEIPDEALVFLTGYYLGRPRGSKIRLKSSAGNVVREKVLFRSIDEFMNDMTTEADCLISYSHKIPCQTIRESTVEELEIMWRMKNG
jgi:hypothetical protein